MSLAREATWCESHGHQHAPFFADMHGIARARNLAVKTAFGAGCDLLLMQDADTFALGQHAYSALERLHGTMVDMDAAVVGAAYAQRNGERVNCEPAMPGQRYEGEVATGLMLIDLRRLADLPQPWFTFDIADDGIAIRCSEDIYFCRRVKGAGHRVAVDYTIATGHSFSSVAVLTP